MPLSQVGTRCRASAKHRIETFLQIALTIKKNSKLCSKISFEEDCYSLDDFSSDLIKILRCNHLYLNANYN